MTNGMSGITLPCTDNADLNPSGFQYTVTEKITGWTQRTYKIQLPSSLGATVDLSALVAAGGTAGGGGVSSVNGKTGAVTLIASDVGAASVDGSGQVPANELGNVPPQFRPWQFRPEDHGSVTYGKIATDVATNGTDTFTSATISAAAIVGQWVMINGARGVDSAAIGTITAISGTSVTIDGTPIAITATATGLNAVFGTDVNTAINAAVAAAKTYAEAHDYYAEVLFSDAIYIVAGLTQSNDGTALYNAQIPIPAPSNNNGRKLVLAFKGAGVVDHNDYWNSTIPNVAGSAVVSMKPAPSTADATYGFQSVFGTPTPESGMAGAISPTFVNVKPVFRDIMVVAPVYTNVTAFDFSYATGIGGGGCSAKVFAQAAEGTGPLLLSIFNDSTIFGSRLGCGLRLPVKGNNADSFLSSFESSGFRTSISGPSEHTKIDVLKALYAARIVSVTDSTSGHGLTINHVTAEGYQGGMEYLGGGTGKAVVHIGEWATETSATASGGGGFDISDPGNAFLGEIHWSNTVDGRDPIVIGAAGLKVINDGRPRGLWSGAPAVPATTVAATNTSWRDATVYVTGTVTGISVNGTAMQSGSTVNPIIDVPAGGTVALTYSAAPTWKWWLD
jgi:hypothetical protein